MMLRVFLLTGFYVVSLNLYASNGITRSAWEKAIEKKDYTENYKEFEAKPVETSQNRERKRELNSGWTLLIILIPLLLLIAIVVFIIYFIIKNTTGIVTERRVNKKFNIDEVDNPDDYENSDLEVYLAEALKINDFRLAVRIKFLIIIKTMKDKEVIVWRKEKTNSDYLNEIDNSNHQVSFRHLVRIFERIWYASYMIDRNTYSRLAPKFDELKVSLES